MWRLLVVLSIVLLCGIASCSSSNNSYYADSENALDTSGYYGGLDHISNYYPGAIALNFPGYIVSFEETSRNLVTHGREDVVLDRNVISAGYTVERLLKTLRFDLPFVSQVMRYEGRQYGEGNCALYSTYHKQGAATITPCDDDPRNAALENHDYGFTFVNSWDAMDILKERLSRDVATNRYTHLVVAVMGLDTAQEESVRNFKSIVSSIRKASDGSFEPLFVGVTWPSFYANRWFDPLWEMFAYPPIADRADILGLSWLGVLLNDVIMPLSDSIEVSIVAHSFGARAASMGLCVGPAILRDSKQGIERQHPGKVENFIGLAAAFSLRRFVEKDYVFYENIYYENYCPMVNRFVFTASSNDAAFGPAFWNDAVGDYEQMVQYCGQEQPVSVACITAMSNGNIESYDRDKKITYIDTSPLMLYTMPGTKGGSHSDIYRFEVGKLLWTVLNESTD
jgi:hypothetical protein